MTACADLTDVSLNVAKTALARQASRTIRLTTQESIAGIFVSPSINIDRLARAPSRRFGCDVPSFPPRYCLREVAFCPNRVKHQVGGVHRADAGREVTSPRRRDRSAGTNGRTVIGGSNRVFRAHVWGPLADSRAIRNLLGAFRLAHTPKQSRRTMARWTPARFSTERIEHKLAGERRICRFSGPSIRRKCASIRTIFEFFAENAKIADCVAERGGFEPPRPFRVYTRSRRAP